MPESLMEYWHWFLRLHNRRPSGMGVCSIPFSEMQAFFSMLGISPEPYEVEIIEMFDSIAMRIISEQLNKEQQKQQKKKPGK